MLLWLLAPDECRHGQIPRQLRSLHEVGVNLIAKVVRKDGRSSLLTQRRTELVQDLLGKSLFDHPSGVLLQNALMGDNLADAVLGELVEHAGKPRPPLQTRVAPSRPTSTTSRETGQPTRSSAGLSVHLFRTREMRGHSPRLKLHTLAANIREWNWTIPTRPVA
jgi:hypothetical protein